jgi:hypothetical protein
MTGRSSPCDANGRSFELVIKLAVFQFPATGWLSKEQSTRGPTPEGPSFFRIPSPTTAVLEQRIFKERGAQA